MKRHIILAYICLTGGIAALATPVTPTYTSFGNLDANWGGNGNPHDPVAVTTIVDGNNTITLGLAAQQRYFNPPVGNDGAGTYFATTGANHGGPGNPSSFNGALWNFDFYFDATGGSYRSRFQ